MKGKLIIVEIVKKGLFPGAPVQKPDVLKTEIEDRILNFNKCCLTSCLGCSFSQNGKSLESTLLFLYVKFYKASETKENER